MRIGLACWASLTLVACGGATESDLFTGPGSNTGVDSGVMDASMMSKDTGTKDTAPPPLDVSVPDVNMPDTAPPPVSTIQCGTTPCDSATDICCRTGAGGSTMTYECQTDPGTCNGGDQIVIACSSDQNCADQGMPGNVCCVDIVQGMTSTIATGVSCRAPADCMAMDTLRTCDMKMPMCPMGQTCHLSKLTLPGYNICF